MTAQALFHITHLDNLPGIASHGLLCRHWIEEENIPYVDLSDPNCQARRTQRQVGDETVDLHAYVPLFFNPRNAMLFRLWRSLREEGNDGQLVILELSAAPIHWRASLIADGIASSHHSELFHASDPAAKEALDWEAIGQKNWYNATADRRRRMMAEVLVEGSLAKRHIRKVWVQQRSLLSSLAQEISADLLDRCNVDTSGELFFRA